MSNNLSQLVIRVATAPRIDMFVIAALDQLLCSTFDLCYCSLPVALKSLLLSCMDYRLVDETERYMTRRGLRDKYDHIVLAGASLGAVTEKYPDWNQTFWDHLGVAIDLHRIHKVMILDHRDCGAYKLILGEDFSKRPKRKPKCTTTYLKRLKKLIKKKHQELEVELLLMNLAGKVERI